MKAARTYLLLLCIVLALLYPFSVLAQDNAGPERPSQRAARDERDGQHDFDFEIGTWKTHIKRPVHPLTQSPSEFSSPKAAALRPASGIMNPISTLWSHPASTLVAVVIVVLVIRLVVGVVRGREKAGSEPVGKRPLASVACFFSGVLFVNALAHFSHGISGERSPVPFGYLLGNGFPEYVSNVLWGFLNAVVGYALFVRGELGGSKSRKIAFFSGMLAMGIFLSYVFSH